MLLLGDVISLGVVMTLLTLVALTATDRFIGKTLLPCGSVSMD